MMKRGWELIALLVIGGYVVKLAIGYISPLVPYMLLALLGGLVALGIYRKNRTW